VKPTENQLASQISILNGDLRIAQERREAEFLHPLATQSALSKGREVEEPLCPIRTAYQRDRDRILHSKAFRRLKHKTQVFFYPVGDHYRTRLTHTLAVAQVSRTIARALQLNEDLAEAIALCHDIGHPPFGHMGERILNELYAPGFHHYLHSARVARDIEKLNLSIEVLDSVSKDTGDEEPTALEGQLVKVADRMAYLHHDVEDAVRAGLMSEKDIPKDILQVLGQDRDSRLNQMILDMVSTSLVYLNQGIPRVESSPEVHQALVALRGWMFEHVYLSPYQQSQTQKVRRLMQGLYEHFCNHPEGMGGSFTSSENTVENNERQVVDYIAGMTDRFAVETYTRLLLPSPYQPLALDSTFPASSSVEGVI
jgi:dGTPase